MIAKRLGVAVPAGLARRGHEGEAVQDGGLRRRRRALEGEAEPPRDAAARALQRRGRGRLRRLGGRRREAPRRDPRARAAAAEDAPERALLRAEPLGRRRARAVAGPARARRRGALRQGAGQPLPPRLAPAALPRGQGSRATARGARCGRRAARTTRPSSRFWQADAPCARSTSRTPSSTTTTRIPRASARACSASASSSAPRRPGTSVYELPPGQQICPYHYEYPEEEWLIVLQGRPTLRTPEGTETLEPWDVVFFPTGPGRRALGPQRHRRDRARAHVLDEHLPGRGRVPRQRQDLHLARATRTTRSWSGARARSTTTTARPDALRRAPARAPRRRGAQRRRSSSATTATSRRRAGPAATSRRSGAGPRTSGGRCASCAAACSTSAPAPGGRARAAGARPRGRRDRHLAGRRRGVPAARRPRRARHGASRTSTRPSARSTRS